MKYANDLEICYKNFWAKELNQCQNAKLILYNQLLLELRLQIQSDLLYKNELPKLGKA